MLGRLIAQHEALEIKSRRVMRFSAITFSLIAVFDWYSVLTTRRGWWLDLDFKSPPFDIHSVVDIAMIAAAAVFIAQRSRVPYVRIYWLAFSLATLVEFVIRGFEG